MLPPDELMVQDFLPSMRMLVAKHLRARGLSQNRISAMLGVTQASVSLYLASDPGRAYASLLTLSLDREEAERYASLLAEDVQRDPEDAVETLVNLWTNLLGKGLICEAHRRGRPSLAHCDVCVRLFGRGAEEDVESIQDVAEAVRLIEESPDFTAAMPEVSVNVARIGGSSDSPESVVAVPGRIVKVNGRARATLPPSAGASRHMARVLLLVRRRKPDVRAVVNLKYDRRMESVLKKLELKALRIGGYSQDPGKDPTLAALAKRLGESGRGFDAIADEGTSGIEPNVYIFGATATDVARLAIMAAAEYSGR